MKKPKSLVSLLKDKISESSEDSNFNIPKIFYCHVPKCAGTSILQVLRKELFSNYKVSTFDINSRASERASRLFKLQIMKFREMILSYNLSIPQNYFGSGFVYCRPKLVKSFMKEWAFITMLRNPIDRWISEYVFNTYKKNSDWSKNTLPINDYIQSETGKISAISYIRYFSSMPSTYEGDFNEFIDDAVANLGRFKLVGSVDMLEKWCQSFKLSFGKEIVIPRENISPNIEAAEEIRSNDSLMQQIELLCEADLSIYHRALEQYDSRDE